MRGEGDTEIGSIAVRTCQHCYQRVAGATLGDDPIANKANSARGQCAECNDREVGAEEFGNIGVGHEVNEGCWKSNPKHKHVERVHRIGPKTRKRPTANPRAMIAITTAKPVRTWIMGYRGLLGGARNDPTVPVDRLLADDDRVGELVSE